MHVGVRRSKNKKKLISTTVPNMQKKAKNKVGLGEYNKILVKKTLL